MKKVCLFSTVILLALAALPSIGDQNAQVKGTAVAYPWSFDKGNKTSQKTAMDTVDEVARKMGYATIPRDVAEAAWDKLELPTPTPHKEPSAKSLAKFGKQLNAALVIYGSVGWHTRSIWVGAGPKTISTATVNVHVFDVRTGKEVYKKAGVEGRSDEKENGLKVAASVLITPVITAVSGGPATPREQRAVQIALGNAFHGWVKGK